MRHRDWTQEEIEAAVTAYLVMLEAEQKRLPYSKADINRTLQEGALRGRTKGAIEYRMQNITSVMMDIGKPWIHGYKPAKNVGSGVRALIEQALAEHGFSRSSRG